MTDQNQPQVTDSDIAAAEAAVVENRGWFIALGILMIVLGIVAIGAPLATTVVAKIFLGWLFLIAGIAQIIHAFYAQGWKGFLADLLMGLLYAFVGGWLAFFPLAGIIGLTVLLAAMFVVEGIFKFAIGLQVRPAEGWGWMIFSGIIAFLAGVLVFMGLPGSAAWAIGLIVGINILMTGIAFLMMALSAGKSS